VKTQRAGKRGTVDLKSLIRSAYPTLSGNQRKVADFLLQHDREIPFLSVVDIEQQTGASKATVVRLAQRLGMSGFLELRNRLSEGVQSAIRGSERFPLTVPSDNEETLTSVARQDVRNINQTISHLDPKVFHEVAEMILAASHTYTAGLGISALMAQVLSYSLNQVAVHATPFERGYETFIEQAPFLTPDDLLVIFSFPPYSQETIDLARVASDMKTPVVAITDKVTSPAAFYSRRVLAIRSQNMIFTNSISAISVVINALVTEIAVRNKAKALKMQKQVETMLHDSGHYNAG
jgi:DNA-binding MurR/RpiR family transcriptional regulator